MLGTKTVSSLDIGTYQLSDDSVTIPRTTPIGYYYIIGRIDSGSVVNESNEGNNVKHTDQN